jgi:hypothetical protein
MEIGQPPDTTVLTFIHNTYPAMYNYVVSNMNNDSINYQTNTKNKLSMRGGHLFLYQYVILSTCQISLLRFCFANIYVKGCTAVPFALTVLYIALSVYKIVVFLLNRPVLHPLFTKQVPRG